MLCQHIGSGVPFFIHGLVATPLQLLRKTKAQDLFQAQQEIEASVASLSDVEKLFGSTVQLATTDRYSANICAEQALASLNLNQQTFHLPCDVHRLSTCKTWQMGVVSSHVSGLVALALVLREAGALKELRSCMFKVVTKRLLIKFEEPPGGQIAEHREAVARLFLSSKMTRTEDRQSILRAQQYKILMYFLNGDWENESRIEFYSREVCDRQDVLRLFKRWVIPALLPSGVMLFPRHRWHGGEVSVDQAGLFFACHNVGGQALQLYLSTKGIPRGQVVQCAAEAEAVSVEDVDAAAPFAGFERPEAEHLDPGVLHSVDECATEHPAPSQAAEAEGTEDAQNVSQQIRLASAALLLLLLLLLLSRSP